MNVQVTHCSVFAVAYSFLAEGTTNATWGGSTHGTLDDLAAEQDNDIQEHSAGYSRSVSVHLLKATGTFAHVTQISKVTFCCVLSFPEIYCGYSQFQEAKCMLGISFQQILVLTEFICVLRCTVYYFRLAIYSSS
jgi:hypothetical protein